MPSAPFLDRLRADRVIAVLRASGASGRFDAIEARARGFAGVPA
jgi:hypothetical protein